MARRFGASESCWDLYDKIRRAHRAHENAAYRVYEKGIYGRKETRGEAVERVSKLQAKVSALEAEWKKKGC